MRALLEESLSRAPGATRPGSSTPRSAPRRRGRARARSAALPRATRRPLRHAHAPTRRGLATRRSTRRSRPPSAAGVRLQVSHLVPRNGDDADARRCIEHRRAGRRRRARRRVRHAHATLRDDLSADRAAARRSSAAAAERQPSCWAARRSRAPCASTTSILSAGGDWTRIVLLDNDGLAAVRPPRPRLDRGASGDRIADDAICDLLHGALPEALGAADGDHPLPHRGAAGARPSPIRSDAGLGRDDACARRPAAGSVFHGAYTWAAWFSASWCASDDACRSRRPSSG